MAEQALIFECQGSRLVGVLHRPDGPSGAHGVGIVIVVGGPQYRVGSHRQFTLMARAFAAAGYPVLRFDYRGMGDSEGESQGFEHVDEDIDAAIDSLRREVPQVERVLLWGLCDAASACLMYLNRNDRRIAALVLANPWVRTVAGEARVYLKHYYLQRFLQRSFWEKLLKGAFDVRRSAREMADFFRKTRARGGAARGGGGRNFLERMYAGLESCRVPLLLLASEHDLTAKEFLDHCASHADWRELLERRRVRPELLSGADHTFSIENSLARVTGRCLEWMSATLTPVGASPRKEQS